ncbi:hypothetical protein AcW1_008990 [Taiwanofungus camphoratus]|nr:hypothetical protein AcW1_008990 [Antrodia cinnamomea]
MNAPPLMPPRGDRTSPTFDPDQPRTIRRYFQDLESLFVRCQIADEATKKHWTTRYPPIDVSDLWESLPECSDVTKTYEDFKKEIRSLYPGTEDDRMWSMSDLDQLIGERARIGINNAADLGSFYREFYAITKYLISKNRLSTIEQSRAFARAFQPSLWARVSTRLQLKFPDHLPDDPYTLDQLHSAAKFVLLGTSTTLTSATTVTTSPTAVPVGGSSLKIEDLQTFAEILTKSVTSALAPVLANQRPPRLDSSRGEHTHVEGQYCHYCGDLDCCTRCCKHIEQDIKDGKCKRNPDGKIVLPNGNFVPRTIPGRTIRDRLYEYHRRNGTNSSPQLLFEIDNRLNVPAFSLSAEDRIAALEHEIYQLRRRREVFDGVEVPQRRRQGAPNAQSDPRNPPLANAPPIGRAQHPVVDPPANQDAPVAEAQNQTPPTILRRSNYPSNSAPSPPKPANASDPPTNSSEHAASTSNVPAQPASQAAIPPPAPPVHPFANARDATYAPPNLRNFAAAPKPTADKGKDVAYKTITPVHQEKLTEEIFARSMRTPVVTLTPEELLSISPDVRARYREAITPKRVPMDPKATHMAQITELSDDLASKTTLATSELSCHGEPLVPGSTIIPDPYETYLRHVPGKEEPSEIIVARDSNSIRSIEALIDNKERIECIVDPGSQVVAMSEQVCHALGLIYDPSVQLNMQSANGSIDRSLGLVRNVSFQVGDIVLYLQIHVIRNPSYDILLGRPFDVVTESVVKNFGNEEQTITIVCPNTSELPPRELFESFAIGFLDFEDLRNQGEVALVVEYESDTPKIVSFAAVNAADNNSVPALYLSVSNSVSSYLQSLYFSETSKVSEGPADHTRWLSGFPAAATPPEAPSLSHDNPNSLPMLSLSASKDISSIPIPGPRNATKVTKSARRPSLAPNPMVSLPKLSDSSPIPTFAASKKKYKPVALKTRPILGALDERF